MQNLSKMKAVHIIALFLPVVLSDDICSPEFVDLINNKNSTWVAHSNNYDENISIEDIKKLLGVKLRDQNLRNVKVFKHSENIQVPDSFDAREHWKQCSDVISAIVDQSGCGSCWAVSAASVMSDRRCIASNGKLKIPVSAEDLLSCCSYCGDCHGTSQPERAWDYWQETGISTGGLYGSKQGCRPYSLLNCTPSCPQFYETPACKHKCDNPKLDYTKELTFGQGSVHTFNSVEDIKKEILINGPVEATFMAYQDFLCYKRGVYQHVAGNDIPDGHAVRVLGWGEENGTPYWLVANSWNEGWGDKGLFKIILGKNEVGIESNMMAARPKI
ncbi:cathepsin B-like [Diabrotica virgifera virgifera]|uniref:Peptidase C1A papain C-terminal domain-containing protein n=1 Tax=Diabrotica virgifera virgifera TaxID=50390 RepID=A0ABM5JQK2_DIAVI|nr:cathepsin B-like [Diabrotica virgifera virgifera]